MDTTLRDGEQTSGVSFSISEKLTLAQLLLQELNIDRIEIASAHVSEGESKAVKGITDWAKSNDYINRIEILTFVDNGRSINWMKKAGAKVQNLLTKGSLNHLKYQLKQTPENHFKNISKCIEIAENEGLNTNVYLEDWSNGMADSRNYVYNYLDFISKQNKTSVKNPEKYDTKMEINLGERFKNKKLLYWAAESSSSVTIKDAKEAYGNFTNSGIIKVSKDGNAIFRFRCPQVYSTIRKNETT